ncbi:hypothetical protein T459_30260 [Capsicum annuum]|uniref:Uncharacterized protein n=1 Tax=Capsicum annuum TaxID=4072 RepID=A0A2G2Y7U5_CAPAN|nr:hypothetical protein T459_30260 [Capsicum annuum]
MLKALGERSYEIKADLLKWLEDVVLLPHPPEMERQDWRLDLAVKEEECRKAVDNENEVSGKKSSKVKKEVNEQVIGILQEASGKSMERVDFSGRQLRMLPKAFGKIHSLIMLNLSNNKLNIRLEF